MQILTSIKLDHIQMFWGQIEDGKQQFAHAVLDIHRVPLQLKDHIHRDVIINPMVVH